MSDSGQSSLAGEQQVRAIRSVPLATQVERILGRQLRAGDYKPGDQLPSEFDLSAALGVSRSTVRIAINALVRDGLLFSKQGVGTFVSEASLIANRLSEAIDFSELIAAGGHSPGVVFDSAEFTEADPHVSQALKLPVGATIHRTAKRFRADEESVIYAITSIPVAVMGDVIELVTADPTITEPLFSFFDKRIGLATDYQVTSLRAVSGNASSYPDVSFPATVALMEMEETGYTTDNQPIWHSVNWYPPSSMQFQLVRLRPPPLRQGAT